jgi:cysteinyl-tRNA synthetase
MYESRTEPTKPVESIAVAAVEKTLDAAKREAWNMQNLPNFRDITAHYRNKGESETLEFPRLRMSRLHAAKKQVEALRRNLDALERVYDDLGALLETDAIETAQNYEYACREWYEAERLREAYTADCTISNAAAAFKQMAHYSTLSSKASQRKRGEAQGEAMRILRIIAARRHLNAEQFEQLINEAKAAANIKAAA